ncbi:MAG: hypothetical protein BJ554DRAFT_6472, partial [Olpidium bornovanus]
MSQAKKEKRVGFGVLSVRIMSNKQKGGRGREKKKEKKREQFGAPARVSHDGTLSTTEPHVVL